MILYYGTLTHLGARTSSNDPERIWALLEAVGCWGTENLGVGCYERLGSAFYNPSPPEGGPANERGGGCRVQA